MSNKIKTYFILGHSLHFQLIHLVIEGDIFESNIKLLLETVDFSL